MDFTNLQKKYVIRMPQLLCCARNDGSSARGIKDENNVACFAFCVFCKGNKTIGYEKNNTLSFECCGCL